MIFKDKDLTRFWEGGPPPKHLPAHLRTITVRKLQMLLSAETLRDLTAPPSNRLEKLKGGLQGKYSIRVNDQYRLVFRWEEGAKEVEFVDYH